MSDAAPSLPLISTLSRATKQEQEHVLALLFEPSSSLFTVALPLLERDYASYTELISTIHKRFLELLAAGDTTTLDDVLSSHPRLGEKKVDSALSRMEQAAMRAASGGSNTSSQDEEAKILQQLNADYETAFPGLRYVVFVNGRPRKVIFKNMRERIGRGDINEERKEAVDAMCDIAQDRAGKLNAA